MANKKKVNPRMSALEAILALFFITSFTTTLMLSAIMLPEPQQGFCFEQVRRLEYSVGSIWGFFVILPYAAIVSLLFTPLLIWGRESARDVVVLCGSTVCLALCHSSGC